MGGALDWLDPRVEDFVLDGDGEEIRDVVRRHWMANAVPAARLGLGLVLFCTAWLLGGLWLLVLIAAAFGLIGQALWCIAGHYRDRLVVTERRVLRVYGNLDQVRASLPMSGIAAIEVERTRLGRVFGYGHLRLVAAAHDRGLPDVRWVPRVDARVELIRRTMADQLATTP